MSSLQLFMPRCWTWKTKFFHVLQGLSQSLQLSFCYDPLAEGSAAIPTLQTALAQGYSAFPVWQPSFHRFTLPDPQVLSALCWQDPQGSVFHLHGFFVLSVGQAATKRLRPWLFTKVAAFLDFQQCIPYGLLVGNFGADWLVFLKVLLSLCIRWAGMLCWKHFHGGNAEILILPVAVSCLAVLRGLFS